MYLQMTPGGALTLTDDLLPMSPCIGLKTASGNMQPGWNASTPDLFAADWSVLD